MWSMVARTVPPVRSPPNPKIKNLILPYASCFDTIFLEDQKVGSHILPHCESYCLCLH